MAIRSEIVKLIKNWEELSRLPDSKTHSLKITPEEGSGWINPLIPTDEVLSGQKYLSTHTFYGKTHEYSTRLLQSCGFDVVLVNWDDEK